VVKKFGKRYAEAGTLVNKSSIYQSKEWYMLQPEVKVLFGVAHRNKAIFSGKKTIFLTANLFKK
jgi:hypothetical protein